MEISYLESRLIDLGWNTIRPGSYGGVPFDLIGSRRFTIIPWKVLIKRIPVLDRGVLHEWNEIFAKLSRAAKRWLVGECFLLCIITDEISLDAIPEIAQDDEWFFGLFRPKGGGGRVIVASCNSRQVYSQIPKLLYDLNRFSREITDLFREALLKEVPESGA